MLLILISIFNEDDIPTEHKDKFFRSWTMKDKEDGLKIKWIGGGNGNGSGNGSGTF